eukprot:4262253-Prymnesium_polylepis.1
MRVGSSLSPESSFDQQRASGLASGTVCCVSSFDWARDDGMRRSSAKQRVQSEVVRRSVAAAAAHARQELTFGVCCVRALGRAVRLWTGPRRAAALRWSKCHHLGGRT